MLLDPLQSASVAADARRVDLHCHCLPGIDDGPESLDDALALCRMIIADGTTDAVATPHQLGRYEGCNFSAEVRSVAANLQAELDAQKMPLRIHPGGEIRVDERIVSMLREDRILTLADGGQFLLLELATAVYIEPEALIARLSETGATIILAHAERYSHLQRDRAAAWKWLECGALLQVNADSLLGGAGAAARDTAWDWLARDWVALVAGDAHNTTTRRPRMSQAIEAITRKLGDPAARRVCIDNPRRVLDGLEVPTSEQP